MRQIISGGQTGADRAALDAALDYGFPCGGCCPAGRQAEDGVIPLKYPLTEISGGYRERTELNVLRASATAIFFDTAPQGGTALTLRFALQHQRPFLLLDISALRPEQAARRIWKFVQEGGFESLNVAGPRQSECPAIYPFVYQTIAAVISGHRKAGPDG